MFKSLILPVGSSDIDGPDFIVLPWGGGVVDLFRKRTQAAKRLAKVDGQLTCLRFRAADALGFFTPAEDQEWREALDAIHVDNSILATDLTPRFYLRRWEPFRVRMPDPPRLSFYPDGSVFLSGPIGLSSIRWETSCGLRVGRGGALESVEKQEG
jgi:hypothetical protein